MLKVKVDLSAIKKNVRYVKSVYRRKICAVVKANAYGHGLIKTAQAIKNDVYAFAVATFEEAMTLFEGGIKNKIYVLGASDFTETCPHNIVLSVTNVSQLKSLTGKLNSVSIKVNTGMNRLGCEPNETDKIFRTALRYGVCVDGIYTHLYNATDEDAVVEQYFRYLEAIKNIHAPIIKHVCASSCLYLAPKYYFDMARVGIAIYGYQNKNLTPAMTVSTRILQLILVRSGQHVSYGDFTVNKDTVVATLRIGYGDGLRRNGSLCFVVNGRKCKSVGKICMDMCMIDVTGVNCKVGDEVTLDVDYLMKSYKITEYEALTIFNSRAKREYLNG